MSADTINLDYNATTPVPDAVWDAVRSAPGGNSSSGHGLGRVARKVWDEARERVAARLGADADEVVFTSGATEANNLAIFGLCGLPQGPIAASMIEHSCVTEPIKQLAKRGYDITWLPVDAHGAVDVAAIPADTRLVVLMRVNHEVGTIQPLVPRGKLFWHCDAAQAAGKIPVNFRELGATTLALSGHKFGAPQGIGVLLVRKDVPLQPLLFGGPHQRGRLPGTEPVALAMGLAIALDIACADMDRRLAQVARLRSLLIETLQRDAVPVVVNSPADGSPYVVNVSFPGLRNDQLLMALDIAGVACSAGPACSSGTLQGSATLKAMGVPEDVLKSALRFSFWPEQTEEEIQSAAGRISDTVKRLRNG